MSPLRVNPCFLKILILKQDEGFMLKVIGFGLLGLFVLIVFPSTITDGANPMFYGTASMVLSDHDGNILMTQTVHNQITDQGENFIIDQVFDTGDPALTDNNRVGAICIISNSDSVFGESATDATANNIAGGTNHCHQTTDIDDDTVSKAITGATTFTAGIDFNAGEIISGILICKKNAGDANFAECNTPDNSVALAALDLNNVTVSDTDTITITYTFDITTSGS